MAVREILLLGNPLLYEECSPVERDELQELRPVVQDLRDTLFDFRSRYGVGRAVSAPQIGVAKRLIYMHIDSPVVFINPQFDQLSDEKFELWDDCMSFPDLLVRVSRHRTCRIIFRDLEWIGHEHILKRDLSELLQHEVDHLNGILAVDRAVGRHPFALRSQSKWLSNQ